MTEIEDLAAQIHALRTQLSVLTRTNGLGNSSVAGPGGSGGFSLYPAITDGADAASALPGIQDLLDTAEERVAAAQDAVAQAVADAEQARIDGIAAGELAGTAAADARDKAQTALANAQTALTNAQTAQTAADNAKAVGDQAKADAATAQTAANNAGTKAQTAFDNAAAAASAASTAQSTANSKGDVLIQSTAPAAAMQKATTIWIDTTNNANTPKRWSGSAWVAVTDKVATDATTAAGNAQTTANSAVTTANGKADVLIQSTTPAASMQKATTLWIDTTNGANTPKRWSGSAWVATTDKVATDAAATASGAQTTATAAQTAANTAQSTADTAKTNAQTAQTAADNANTAALNAAGIANGKGKVIYSATAPTGADQATQNLWIDTSGTPAKNTPNRWSGSAWVAVTDKAATDAASAASAAQTSANNAASAASAAQSTADTAKANAATAQGRADAAFTAAGNAQTAANTAQSTADTAKTNAATAQSTADTAKTNAATAQSKADQASTDAASAAGIANGKADTLIQSTAPAAAYQKSTTLWIDTTNSANTPKRWSGSAWVAVTDKAATDAASAAATAKTAADNAKTAADNAQTSANAAKTAADNAQTTANNAATAASNANDAATAAGLAANNAQTTANGKNKSTYSTAAPSNTTNPGTAAGDIWFQRNTSGNLVAVFEWSGSAWTARPIDNAMIANLDAGKITAGYISSARIASGTITGDQIAARTITASDIAANAITANEIAANTITASLIAAGTITAAQIASGTITGDRIAAGTLTATLIAAGAIGTGQLAANAVTAAKIAAGTITGDLIAAGTVATNNLLVGNFDNLLDNPFFDYGSTGWVLGGTASISTDKAYNGHVNSAKLTNNGSIQGAALTASPGDQYTMSFYYQSADWNGASGGLRLEASANGTTWASIASGGLAVQSGWTLSQLSGTIPAGSAFVRARVALAGSGTVYVTNLSLRRRISAELIVDGTITTDALAANAVTAAKITAGTITGDRLAGSTITGDKVAANTLTAGNIAANTITASQIAAATLTSATIAANAITSSQIAADAVLARNIKAGEVTATHIAAATITGSKIAANTITAGNIAAGTITANEIAAGAITASKLSADAINGKTITGVAITGGSLATSLDPNSPYYGTIEIANSNLTFKNSRSGPEHQTLCRLSNAGVFELQTQVSASDGSYVPYIIESGITARLPWVSSFVSRRMDGAFQNVEAWSNMFAKRVYAEDVLTSSGRSIMVAGGASWSGTVSINNASVTAFGTSASQTAAKSGGVLPGAGPAMPLVSGGVYTVTARVALGASTTGRTFLDIQDSNGIAIYRNGLTTGEDQGSVTGVVIGDGTSLRYVAYQTTGATRNASWIVTIARIA